MLSTWKDRSWSALEKNQRLRKKTDSWELGKKQVLLLKTPIVINFQLFLQFLWLKLKKLYRTLNEKTGERIVKNNLNIINENKHTTTSPTIIVDMFNKNFVNVSTTVESPTTQELKGSNKNFDIIDDNIFAFPTSMIEIFLR